MISILNELTTRSKLLDTLGGYLQFKKDRFPVQSNIDKLNRFKKIKDKHDKKHIGGDR